MKQTAIEWLRQKWYSDENITDETFEQAKEMERQQKRADFTDGYMHGSEPLNHGVIDKWYNNTYGGNK